MSTQFRYSAFGDPVLIARTPAGGAAINNTAAYDALGHKTAMTDPDRGSWIFSYNVLGELTRQTDAMGLRSWFDYDGLGRVSARYEAPGTDTKPLEPIASWNYFGLCVNGAESNGRLLCASNSDTDTSTRYQYNSAGLLLNTSATITPPAEASKVLSLSQSYCSAPH